MKKHILVTISDNISCLHGVRFVGSFFRGNPALRITLVFVEQTRPDSVAGSMGSMWEGGDGSVAPAASPKALKALNAATRLLVSEMDFKVEQINSKVMPGKRGIPADIIHEGQSGLYDAVVLGKRALGVFESLFTERITDTLLLKEIVFPFWTCRNPVLSRKNVLLCADGSDAAARIADHVGFMLHDQQEHRITILSIDNKTGRNPDDIIDSTAKVLKQNGIDDHQIESRVIRSKNILNTIRETAAAEAYAVVAVGREGHRKTGFEKWLAGSTCRDLVQEMTGSVLWISR